MENQLWRFCPHQLTSSHGREGEGGLLNCLQLQPAMHLYWPIRHDDNCKSIKFAVVWGNNHKQKAQAIGKAASNFIQQELKMDFVYDYMFHPAAESEKKFMTESLEGVVGGGEVEAVTALEADDVGALELEGGLDAGNGVEAVAGEVDVGVMVALRLVKGVGGDEEGGVAAFQHAVVEEDRSQTGIPDWWMNYDSVIRA
ncbi:PREDICTED: O-glucosyltransferase [Prunus dulcis]|uniref:PREDICTED: O-glucosyltransferase n=1 Tax=Prunus dulcis TaxID=3755 RepID=A0A5E4FSG6_PRUDU|nr:PREDICTED: O-glucosyltransferase [Prunus dulcis]